MRQIVNALFSGFLIILSSARAAEISERTVTKSDSLISADTVASPADSTVATKGKTHQDDTTKTSSSKKDEGLTDTVHYEAENIDYDAEAKTLLLTKNARVDYQNLTLFADTIHYLMEKNIFTASGKPQLVEGGDTTVGDYMVYNIKTRRGRVNYASTHMTDAYFNGNKIIKSEKNELYVDAGDYTTCAHADTPHYCFYGRQIKVVPNDKIISKPVVFNIGEAPVLILPYFIFPMERNRRSGFLTPRWGGHPTGGGYMENLGYYFAFNDYMDLTLSTRIKEFSEFIARVESSYKMRYRLNGSVSSRYVINSDYQNKRREWSLNYTHNQNITPDGKTKLTGNGNLLSTSKFYSQFSEENEELREQYLTANLSLSHSFDVINGRTNVSLSRRHNLQTDEIKDDLPKLTFNLPNRPLIPQNEDADKDSLKWFNKIYWNYASTGLMKHASYASDTAEETFYPGMSQKVTLSSPQTIFKWITVNPSLDGQISSFLGYRDTQVVRYDTLYDTVSYVIPTETEDTDYGDFELISQDTLRRTLQDSVRITKHKKRVEAVHNEYPDKVGHVTTWSGGVSLGTNLYGIFPIRLFNFAGIRHTFKPSVSYRFRPEHKLDREFFLKDISYDRGHKQSQTVSLSIGNLFEGKTVKEKKESEKPVENKFTLFNLSGNTSYDFEADSRKWSDLNTSASTGFRNVRISGSARFWMYDEHNELSAPLMSSLNLTLNIGTINARGSFWGGDLLVLDSLHDKDNIKYANAGKNNWSVSFTPGYSFSLTRSSPSEIFTPKKNYNLSSSASLNITRDWSLRWSSTYNFQSDQWVQNSINLACDLECWDMRFQWRPEKLNPGYYFIINIKKIPEIKWEQRR